MTNQQIADILLLTSKLLELFGENPFKVKAYQKAVMEIERYPQEIAVLLAEAKAYELPFSKNLVEKLKEIVQTGTLKELEKLLAQTPKGVLEMLEIKGLGPKKVRTIWLELGIDNVADLLHACYENRLMEVKGFGQKSQDSIRRAIELYRLSKGKLHLHKAFEWKDWFLSFISEHLRPTGQLLTWDNVIDSLEWVTSRPTEEIRARLLEHNFRIILNEDNVLTAQSVENLIVKIYFCREEDIEKKVFQHSSNEVHNRLIGFDEHSEYANVQALYEGFPYVILPPHRYEPNCFEYYERSGGRFIENQDVRGLVHAHSRYSDGKHTLLQMAEACRQLGYEYMVITDHSPSAFYANGLSPARLEAQWKEIEQLNSQWSDFQIFKGTESDILSDGSLDYEEEILKSLDCVIASIHSHFKMDVHQATARLIKAIENPYTRILGHPTGRLLLIRDGYPIDYEKVIDACARNRVAIEINANPYRLDWDWRWLRKAVDKGVEIVISPDAHSIEGIQDVQWGVKMANKAFLTPQEIVNTRGLSAFQQWLKSKR